jgi:hypothetical protein
VRFLVKQSSNDAFLKKKKKKNKNERKEGFCRLQPLDCKFSNLIIETAKKNETRGRKSKSRCKVGKFTPDELVRVGNRSIGKNLKGVRRIFRR